MRASYCRASRDTGPHDRLGAPQRHAVFGNGSIRPGGGTVQPLRKESARSVVLKLRGQHSGPAFHLNEERHWKKPPPLSRNRPPRPAATHSQMPLPKPQPLPSTNPVVSSAVSKIAFFFI